MVSDIEKMAADQSSVRPDYETPVPSRSHSIMSSSGISGHSSALEPIATHHTDVHAINSGSNGYDISACMSRATTRDLERHPTLLSRMATQRSQHNETVGSTRSRPLDKPLPPFGAGKPYPPPLPEKEEYVVEFDGPDDPLHPQNWSLKRK